MRAAALALIVAAFARPFFTRGAAATAVAAGGTREVVILLDQSASMGYGDHWTRARDEARKVIASLSVNDKATLVLFSRNAEVPMMVIAVGSRERIGRVLPELGALLHRPLLTVERVRICKRDGQLYATPHARPGTDEHGMALWQKLMVYTSEAVQHHGQPIHRAIIRRLRSAGISGATTVRPSGVSQRSRR